MRRLSKDTHPFSLWLSETLKELYLSSGLNLSDFARLAGVSSRIVQLWMHGVSTPDLNDVNSLEKIATMIESTTGVRGLYKKISELLPELNLSPEKLQLVSLYRKMNSANKYRISAFIDLLLNDQGTPRTVGEKMNSLRDFLGMTLDAHQTHISSFDSSRIHKMVIPTEVFDAMYDLFLLGAYWTDLDAEDVTIVQQRLVEMRNTAVDYTKKAESQRGIYV